MDTAYFFSDETGSHSTGRYFAVCGVALTRHRKYTEDQITHAERVSNKGRQDWKGTKNPKIRINYVEELLKIEELKGAVFYSKFLDNNRQYWNYTVKALTRAIQQLGKDRHSIIRHQGFNHQSRQNLKAALREAGCSFEIQSGTEKHAGIRLADGLCGYIGTMVDPENERKAHYPDLPEWFIEV